MIENKHDTAPLVFNTKFNLRFSSADPAGVMFFGNILMISHDLFEDFIKANNIAWTEWFKNGDFICPIRHTEVDFLAPMLPGQEYSVTIKIGKITKSSFNMHYEFKNHQNKLCVRTQITHVFVDPKTMQKTNFPLKFLNILEKYCLPDSNEFNFS